MLTITNKKKIERVEIHNLPALDREIKMGEVATIGHRGSGAYYLITEVGEKLEISRQQYWTIMSRHEEADYILEVDADFLLFRCPDYSTWVESLDDRADAQFQARSGIPMF